MFLGLRDQLAINVRPLIYITIWLNSSCHSHCDPVDSSLALIATNNKIEESLFTHNTCPLLQHTLCHSVCLWLTRIDCVGILKRRNADIELRNGETDIGRKNTRVRLVFRVHIPQPGGQLLSLQVASDPIECCKKCFTGDGTESPVDLISDLLLGQRVWTNGAQTNWPLLKGNC